MPDATNEQMQVYCDTRIRPRAEAFRLFLAQIADDKASIGDEYARAASVSAWADARDDGPPHLLQAGNSANPDDVLNYNAFITALLEIVNTGGNDAADAATLRSTWAVLNRACVRAVT